MGVIEPGPAALPMAVGATLMLLLLSEEDEVGGGKDMDCGGRNC
jgi:hypothetical protein